MGVTGYVSLKNDNRLEMEEDSSGVVEEWLGLKGYFGVQVAAILWVTRPLMENYFSLPLTHFFWS